MMLVLPSVITLAALSVTTAVALSLQESRIREATAERVQEVATSLAVLREVREVLEQATTAGAPDDLADAADLADATGRLQPIAELVAQAAGVYYVVVTDDEGVRITHPLAAERGVQVSTTNESVLAGTPFLGTETGPSGPSFRAKEPVRDDDGDIVGMVAVGVREADIAAERADALGALLPWAVGALVVATLASSVLTAAVERRFRRLDGLAAEHAQMQRTTTALREQAHEFHTRLHVVHGLVSRGDAGGALGYIEGVVPVAGADADPSADAPLLDATVHAVRAELLERGTQVEFELRVAADIDDEVVTVLSNLCRNAGEAGATRVRCTLEDLAGRLVGAVEDDGPGVDARIASRIFSPGFSSKPDATGWGRGVGLELVRRIVTSRGGTVEVGSSALGGARFAFDMAAQR
ncbi:histidine kinase [Microbacterium marinilacus]|nr:histidine kinase [Microbacterium marinilacus]